jgi:hypothetical protein
MYHPDESKLFSDEGSNFQGKVRRACSPSGRGFTPAR